MLFENSRKIICVGEAALHCDLKHRHIGMSQQVYGFIEAFDQDIFLRRMSRCRLEKMAEMPFAQMAYFRQALRAYILKAILFYITDRIVHSL